MGTLNGRWVPPATRDEVVTYVERWTSRAAMSRRRLLGWLELAPSKVLPLAARTRPTAPRDGWLSAAERQAILDFHARHPLDGYRRLAYRLLDAGLVAASHCPANDNPPRAQFSLNQDTKRQKITAELAATAIAVDIRTPGLEVAEKEGSNGVPVRENWLCRYARGSPTGKTSIKHRRHAPPCRE